ncbi:MAG: asparaginase domain-containing protein [Candidatus Marinimicrobia bacterium]|nr:asparaginase [bacterium]MCG2714970.1 asparaginase domain-containing protein [Candidatus Neomarinimicrobiota bacterium]
MIKIKIFTVGGTIDKIYFDQKNAYQIGEPKIVEVLQEANVTLDYETESIMQKDSLDMTEEDRRLIFEKVASDPHELIVITHGTDTMVETAHTLSAIPNKTIVLTGSMQPARFKNSDAGFNIGCAVAAVQALPHGVYITMNGQIFDPEKTRKNADMNCFETI